MSSDLIHIADQQSFGGPSRPLRFIQVMEGHPPISNAGLFTLPSDLLSEIVSLIDRPSLSSLAFLNRDAWQLARSRQFSSVRFTYDSAS